MNVALIKNADIAILEQFVDGLNAANFARSNIQIPYEKYELCDIIKKAAQPNVFFYHAVDSAGKVIGGACCTHKIDSNNYKVGIISNVWVHPNEQKKGISKQILYCLEKHALSLDTQMLQLNVANIYMPALSLYKRLGFVPLLIYANVPGTYYFIRMIKPLDKFVYPNYKRIIIRVLSWIKFQILFKKDSTPKWVHKLIYGK